MTWSSAPRAEGPIVVTAGSWPRLLTMGILFTASAALCLSLSGCGGSRLPQELPIGNVDTPSPGTTAKGSVRLSGWALSNAGIERIDVYLDGKLAASSNSAVNRPDVRKAYPNYGGNENCGFDFQLDLSGKSAGSHELTVQARSRDDAVRDLYRYPIIVAP